MSNNLLELINEHISPDVIATLSGFLGESPKNTTSALSNAIPSILAGLVHKSSDSQGASALFDLLGQGSHDGGILDNLVTAFAGGEGTSKLLSTGSTLLTSILGNKAEGVANLVANASGMSKTSSNSLLGLLAPMILGVLGKTVNAQGINSAAGLASLLASQSGFLKNFLPAGLSSILGLPALAQTGKSPGMSAPPVLGEESGGFGKWLPWLLLPVILALGWGLLKYFKLPPLTPPESNTQQATTPATPEQLGPAVTAPKVETPATPPAKVETPPAPAPKVEAPSAPAPTVETPATPAPAAEAPKVSAPEVVAPVVEKIGNFFEKTLSSGFAIKASKDGIENKLIGFLDDKGRAIDKKTWFTMNGILFDTAKASLRPESDVQLKNIAEIMKAFPAVKIKIGGYTDNVGQPKSNVKLSAERANAVKNALVSAGIDAARLAAEGFGSAHPVADNKSEAGRQQNRRIDVQVTAK
jgi:outer membrane protein OmpA-like peptidoglycan-associated protein